MSQVSSQVAARSSKGAKRGHTTRFLLASIGAVLATVAVAASDPPPPDSDVQSTEKKGRPALLVSDSGARKKSPASTDGSADESEEDCE